MGVCEVCGNQYDKSIVVIKDNQSHTFDSFECAIHALAPRCEHCGCTIVGHGIESDGKCYCCAHCAVEMGVMGISDRTELQTSGAPGAHGSQVSEH